MNVSIPLPGHFTLLEVMARGAHSSLLRVHDSRSDSTAAVKRLEAPTWLTTREADAYLRRASESLALLAGLEHPNLAPVLELEREHCGNSLLVVREFVSGIPLTNLVEKQWVLGQFEARRIASEIGAALDFVASMGNSHGALTPNNVIVREDGGIVLTDAGLAGATQRFSLAGQNCSLRGRYSAAGDIQALAKLVFKALTGMDPGRNVSDARRLCSSADLPHGMRAAVRRALLHDRRAFRTASDFAESLNPIAAHALFRHVWRPAAAAGLLASLATIGGNAVSEARRQWSQARHLTNLPSAANLVPTIAEAPHPIINLAAADADALHSAVRRQGRALLAHPAVAELFDLTAGQKTEMAACLAEHRSRVGQMVDSVSRGKMIDSASEMAVLKAESGARILSILNSTQRVRWEELERASARAGEPPL